MIAIPLVLSVIVGVSWLPLVVVILLWKRPRLEGVDYVLAALILVALLVLYTMEGV